MNHEFEIKIIYYGTETFFNKSIVWNNLIINIKSQYVWKLTYFFEKKIENENKKEPINYMLYNCYAYCSLRYRNNEINGFFFKEKKKVTNN